MPNGRKYTSIQMPMLFFSIKYDKISPDIFKELEQ
jgi:hypothetical protein